MRHRQRGMTLIGWMIVLAIIGVFAAAAIRLIPVYLEHIKITTVLSGVQEEFDGQQTSVAAIRRSIQTRFDVEGVAVMKPREIEVKKSALGYTLRANYDHRTPFLGNVGFVVSFDNRVEIKN